MGIVVADYRFIWANVGLPGSVNDSRIFQASHLYNDMVTGNALPDIKKAFKCTGSKRSTTTSNFVRRLCCPSSFLAAKTTC